jgi:hypothetical protein
MGRSAVFPAGTDILVGIPDTFGQDFLTGFQKQLVGAAHETLLLLCVQMYTNLNHYIKSCKKSTQKRAYDFDESVKKFRMFPEEV